MLRVLCVALIALTTGCTVLHPTDPFGPTMTPADRPAVERSRSQPRSELPQGALSLAEAIRIALENNPEIVAARWESEAARERVSAAASARWPSLTTTATLSRYATTQRLSPPTLPGEPLVFTDQAAAADLVLALPLFTGGSIDNRIRAAELLNQAALNGLTRTREQIVFNVSSVFYGILRQQHVVQSVEFSVRAMEAQRQTVVQMMDAGKAARVDVLRIEVRLADLRQRLVTERNALAVQKRVLAYLLRIQEREPAIEPQGDLSLVPFDAGLSESVQEALANRPDYLSARWTLEAQARRVDVARAARWPGLYLSGSYGVRWAIAPSERPPGSDATRTTGSIGLVIAWPLFDGGRITAQVAEERAVLAVGRERLADLEMRIRLEVEGALLNVEAGRARVEATETSIEQARESLRIEREKYRLGKGSTTDVLDAQSALLSAETAYYAALAEYNTAVAQVRLAVGEPIGEGP